MRQELLDPTLWLSRQAGEDILTRLPTHKASRIGELLPHRWQPTNATT